jgi:adenine-specific DNA glycosylase
MELGATVCKPVNPMCEACPVNTCCAAYKQVGTPQASSSFMPSPCYVEERVACGVCVMQLSVDLLEALVQMTTGPLSLQKCVLLLLSVTC